MKLAAKINKKFLKLSSLLSLFIQFIWLIVYDSLFKMKEKVLKLKKKIEILSKTTYFQLEEDEEIICNLIDDFWII